MKLEELKEQLSKGVVKPLYVFTGPEVGIMDIYLKKIAEVSRKPIKRVDTVAAVYSKLQNQSFAPSANCYVIRDDKDYFTQEKVWESLISGRAQGYNVVILLFTDIDKRSKFYKQHTAIITEFEKLIPEVLAKYIKRELDISTNKALGFATICDCDYSRILLETSKIRSLSKALGITEEQAYDQAIREKLIWTAPKDVVFEFIDAFCRRQTKQAFILAEKLKAINDSPLGTLTLLYNNLKSILLVQSSGNVPDMTERTGLTAWQVKMAKEKLNYFTTGELLDSMEFIRKMETGIKTGKVEANIALDYTLVSLI